MLAIALLPLVDPLIGLLLRTPGPPRTGGGVPLVVNPVLLVAAVLLAVADRRILLRRGVVRPLHWAWAALTTVYVIARSVVVRRRADGSLLPLWIWIAATLVGGALGFIPR